MEPLANTEEDPARLWAEIHRLRVAVQGPDGYATWQDAATAERVRRVRLRAVAEYAAHQLECARIWNGMDWHYNPLHPLMYRPALERLRDALEGDKIRPVR